MIEISMFGYFFYIAVYNFILSLAGLFVKKSKTQSANKFCSIGIFIPAYKEDSVIVKTAEEALKIDYPENLIDVIVIADSLRFETLTQLRMLPIHLIEVSFDQSTKVKAIQKAILICENHFDFFIVLDADNIMKPDFLLIANQLYNDGIKIVQGKRIAKNQENPISVLDDLSEQINNHINRKGTSFLGGSSSIAGSGFFIDKEIGIEVFNQIDSIGGFDKELELHLLLKKIKTHYCESMIIFDEKVNSTIVFKNQRRRWISSQYFYFFKYFNTGLHQLFSQGYFAYFNSAILRNFQLPRLLNLAFFTFVIFLTFFFSSQMIINTNAWFIIYSLFLSSILIAIPRSHYNKKTVLSLLKLPKIFYTMFILMFQLKGSNTRFIHTPHDTDNSSNNE